jgi:hypothetical protein
MDTIDALCDNPTAITDPYSELQNILLQSYGLNAAHKTALRTTQASGVQQALCPDGPA